MLDENFGHWVSEHGSGDATSGLTEAQIAFASQHLPESFVAFLKLHGYAHFSKLGWQVVDLGAFRHLGALIFKNDPELSNSRTHIVGHSAFGDLLCWSEEYWMTSVSLLTYEIGNRKLAKPIISAPPIPAKYKRKPVDANRISLGLLPYDAESVEFWDFYGQPLYKACRKQFGLLNPGECYGFNPSLGTFTNDTKTRQLITYKNTRRWNTFAKSPH